MNLSSLQLHDMRNSLIEIAVILLLIVINGMLAMTEIAFVSSRKVKLRERATAGNRGAQAALQLLKKPEQIFSTVQVGITLIAILTGVFGGATLAGEVELVLKRLPLIGHYAGGISVGLIVVTTTYVALVIGELTPKQIGLQHAEAIAAAAAPSLQKAARGLSALINVLSYSTQLILRLLRVRVPPQQLVTDEEIKLLIKQGLQGGAFEAIEEHVIDRLFHLSDQRIRTIMTPRVEVVWLDTLHAPQDNLQKILGCGFDKFPVATGRLDRLRGVINLKDILAQQQAGEPFNLEKLVTASLVLPETTPAFQALVALKQNAPRMAMVINEFGGVEGLITASDILQALVGDFPEAVHAEPDIVQREDGSWLVDGRVLTMEIMDLLSLTELPIKEEDRYDTLGGIVLAVLDRIPKSGDHFVWQDWRFEVVDMDGQRVDKVLVTPQSIGTPRSAFDA